MSCCERNGFSCQQGRECPERRQADDPCLFSTEDIYSGADLLKAIAVVAVIAAVVWGALV